MRIAEAVAAAGREDQGFLGRGGVQVNDAERSELEEIASVLGITGTDAAAGPTDVS